MKNNIENVLLGKGGRLDPSTVDGAAGQHLADVNDFMRAHLAQVVVPGPGPVSRTTPPSRISQFEFVRRWDVNAWAILADEKPIVLFHAGIPFSLFEYFNALLAQPTIIPRLDGLAERREFEFSLPGADFSNIPTGKWPSFVPLTTEETSLYRSEGFEERDNTSKYVLWSHYLPQKPRSEARALFALDAYLASIYFLFCHELGHIDRGHLEYRHRNTRDQSDQYALCEFAAEGSVSSPILRALELDADQYALRLTLGPHIKKPSGVIAETLAKRNATIQKHFSYPFPLFALGALFLLLEAQSDKRQQNPPKWISWLLEPRSNSNRTHPNSFTRIRNSIFIANWLEDHEKTLHRASAVPAALVEDLTEVARLLRIDVSPLASPILCEELVEVAAQLKTLVPELADCRAAIQDHYFRDGKRVSLQQAKENARPADPDHLAQQSLRITDVDTGESVTIPFLTDHSPVEQYLDNSRKWERVGVLDNAFLYARLAHEKDSSGQEAQNRIDELRRTLGDHYVKLEEWIKKYGPISHLANKFRGDFSNSKGPLPPTEITNALETLVAVRPKDTKLRFQLAQRYYLLKNYQCALDEFVKVERAKPMQDIQIEALVGAGNACAELKRIDDACGFFQRGLELDPHSQHALENQAICLVRGGRAAEAVSMLEQVLTWGKENSEYWFLYACALHALGNRKETSDAISMAIKLAPENEKYHAALAELGK